MANYLNADVTICGSPENREAFIKELREKHEIYFNPHNEDTSFIEGTIEFRWNMDALNEEVAKTVVKHGVSIDAQGTEWGVGFFQQCCIDREGKILTDTMELASVFFDYTEEED